MREKLKENSMKMNLIILLSSSLCTVYISGAGMDKIDEKPLMTA